MITGGTGSLGQALVRRLLSEDLYKFTQSTNLIYYDKIIVYSRSEHKQEEMHNALAKTYDTSRVRYHIGDIRDYRRLATSLRGNDVSTIINAAALKIVPTGEYNPIEFVKTNIYGVQNVIEAAAAHHVTNVMQISTDKAVAPINLYGATKLTAEKMILAANNMYGEKGPRYAFVRYGNVVGSAGSVVPLFLAQKVAKRPLTITNPNMTRFWITLDDAVDWVLESISKLYTDQRIFVPEMRATTVRDVATAIVGRKYPRKLIGSRSGEKVHEVIFNDAERYDGRNNLPQTSEWAPRMTVRQIRGELKKLGML